MDKLRKLWRRFADWLIGKLGGYRAEDFMENEKKLVEASSDRELFWKCLCGASQTSGDVLEMWTAECVKREKLEEAIGTVQAEIRLPQGMNEEQHDVIALNRQEAVRRLGEAVYPYAQHFITPDGVYITTVNIYKGGCKND